MSRSKAIILAALFAIAAAACGGGNNGGNGGQTPPPSGGGGGTGANPCATALTADQADAGTPGLVASGQSGADSPARVDGHGSSYVDMSSAARYPKVASGSQYRPPRTVATSTGTATCSLQVTWW